MIECIFLAGLWYIAGTDINGDRYFANIDMIVSATQNMSISDGGGSSRTIIQTVNGTIVEDLDILDVAVGISRCEDLYNELSGE
jgi:hypothetical protein